jgi:hypothetical protein
MNPVHWFIFGAFVASVVWFAFVMCYARWCNLHRQPDVDECLEILEACIDALKQLDNGGPRIISEEFEHECQTRRQLDATMRAAAGRLEALADPAKFPNPSDI